jgi:hypothetical protein
LLEVVLALGFSRRLAGRLYRRQQKRDQDGNDRNHHQEFHQVKPRGDPERRMGERELMFMFISASILAMQELAIRLACRQATKVDSIQLFLSLIGENWGEGGRRNGWRVFSRHPPPNPLSGHQPKFGRERGTVVAQFQMSESQTPGKRPFDPYLRALVS